MSPAAALTTRVPSTALVPAAVAPALRDDRVQRRTLIQLVAPGGGGVRDYVECLQREWQAAHIDSHVITLSEADAVQEPLVARLQEHIGPKGQPCSVVLHFSGYGFHPRGLCFWLVREIERARSQLGEQLRWVTVFHELFASGPPWRSAFWLSRLQATLAARIARASDGLWTNTEAHGRWLRTQVDDAVPIEVQPVFSNIGEPEFSRPASDREVRLIVFGSHPTRGRAIKLLPRHAALLHRKGIREVVEVGSGAPHPVAGGLLRHRFVGRLDAADLRILLENSAYGLVDYPAKYLGKSSVFAAYAVHGCISLNTAEPGEDSDGLRASRHFVNLKPDAPIPQSAESRQVMSDAGRAWYARHSLPQQAQALVRCCRVVQQAESGQ